MCIYEITEIVNAVASVVKTVVEVQETRIEKAENEYNAQVMVSKAKKAENQAAYERQEGLEEARRQRLNAILTASDTKAEIAAGNLGLSSMTSLNLLNDDKKEGENEADKILRTSETRASNYIDSANNYYRQATLHSFNTKRNYKKKLYKAQEKGVLGIANAFSGLMGD